MRKFLEKAGKQLEDPDLTDLHVDGMQIFGGNGLGIARKDMPQIPKEMREDFLRDVKTAGIDVKLEKVSPLSLAPTQKEISARLAAEKLDKYERDPKRAFPPILVDKSNHVLDGHHHWGMAAAVSIDHPDLKIPVYRIMTDNVKARGLMTAFDRKHGITGKDTGLSWDEGALTDRDLFLLTRLPDDEEVINLPFAEYEDFADCVDQNQDKDDPEAFCGWLKHRIEGAIYPGARYAVVNLPDVADVNFPSLIGAIPAKPPTKKRRKRYIFKGVSLSRKPLNFEVQILALTAIPRRLDLARDTILADRDDGLLRATMEEIAQYGADEVMRELQRQGAPRQSAPMVTIDTAYETFIADRDRALKDLRGNYEYRLCRRRISASRRDVLVTMLTGGREPGLRRRFANRAINEMFALGRGLSISVVRRRKLAVEYALAKHHDDEDDGDGPYQDETGQFISKADAIAGGDITVDAIVQTAIMDTATCDACSEVDGEVMDLGSDRQEELHPPYVMCEGGDACRCVQIALLSDGTEMDVDEIDEDTLPDSAEDDF